MKKILLSILVSIIGLISFGYCFIVPNGYGKTVTVGSYTSYLTFSYADHSINYTACIGRDTTTCNINFIHNGITDTISGRGLDCFTGVIFNSNTSNNPYFTNNGNSCSVYAVIFPDTYGGFCNSCPSCPSCEDQYTSEECQQEYSLMPISSCDSEFCGLNGLCPEYTGSVMSQLYINGIEHLSAPMINITIPMEVQRNYEYTGVNEDVFDLNIGSQQGDENYIQGIIDVNSYRPTSEDFTQTFVGGLTLIFPYIIITAVILFIWRFIRKIFK